MEIEVDNSDIKFNLEDYKDHLRSSTSQSTSQSIAANKSLSRVNSANNPYNIQFLGRYNTNGLPDYILGEIHNGELYPMPAVIPEGLVNRLNNILVAQDNSHLAVSTKVINTNIVKDARIKLTFLGEAAAYRNVIGYYYYNTKNPPSGKN